MPWHGRCLAPGVVLFWGRKLELSITSPAALMEQKESMCRTTQPFAASDSRRKPWVWPQKLSPP